jgi:branched-chain amino acid transport system permease protein
MTLALLVEQLFNGLQFGMMLFLMAVGVTLVFGIMRVINLAHGSLFMIGGYFLMAALAWTQSYALAVPLAFIAAALVAVVLETSCCGRSIAAARSTRCWRRSA